MLEFSSTCPDAFDTKKIALAKWNQVINNDKKTVFISHSTLMFSAGYNEPFDTKVITLEKRLQCIG